MERTLSYLPFSIEVKSKLLQNGFIFASQIDSLETIQLGQKSSLSIQEAQMVKDVIQNARNCPVLSSCKSAAAWLEEEENYLRVIVTFCKELDTILGGGISLGRVTEVAGEAGVGKTQLCFQLCVDVQIPKELGGCQGEAVFIDAEGNFSLPRIRSMAEACVEYCQDLALQTKNPACVRNLTIDCILKGIYCYRCRDYEQLLHAVDLLDRFIANHNLIKLIIIDSIAFNFRHEIEDAKSRIKLLFQLSATLNSLCQKYNLAVVITNQMTTTFNEEGEGTLVPALGELWSFASSMRLVLSLQNSLRWAGLCKAPHLPIAQAPYQVTTGGIRDRIETAPF